MPVVTTASLDDTLPKFIAEAKLTLRREGLMKGLVKRVTLGRGNGLTYNVPTWSAVTVLDLVQGQDLAQAQAVTDANFAVVVAEIGGQIFFSDALEMALKEDVMREFGRALANVYAQAIDIDITEDMDTLTTSLGGAGTTAIIGRLLAAATRLEATNRPTEGPLSCVLHPFQYHAIAEDLAGLSGGRWINATGTPAVERSFGASVNGLSQELVERYWVGKLAGVNVYHDRNIAVDASDDAKGGMFARDALVSVMYEEPRTRPQRDESLRGMELNYVGWHGSGVYDGAWGFELYSDASTPSS